MNAPDRTRAPYEIPLPPEPPDPEDMEGDPDVCEHPEDQIYFEPGNYVHPYGWEQRPAWVCEVCGDVMEPPENDDYDEIAASQEQAAAEREAARWDI